MNGQVRQRTFKERWNQIMENYLSKDHLKPASVQDYNESIMLELLGTKLIDLINEETEKLRKVMDGLGIMNSEVLDHAEVLKDQLERLRTKNDNYTEEEESTEGA